MVIISFQRYIAYLITFIKQFTTRGKDYGNFILNINIVGSANDPFQGGLYYNKRGKSFSNTVKPLGKSGFNNLLGPSRLSKGGFSSFIKPSRPSSNGFSGIAGLSRFKKGGFNGISKGGNFTGLPKLPKPLKPLDKDSFKRPPGLLGPSGLPSGLFQAGQVIKGYF